jgi:predicted Fe-Mo cluster-binding NifX family protein
MRICIPTETNSGTGSRVSDHFGGSPFYVVVDTETDGVEVVSGEGCHGGGSSDHHVGQLSAHGVHAVACRGMGRRAFAAMRAAGLDVLRTEHGTVSEVLEAAREGRLSRLTEDEACGGGRHHRGRHHYNRHDDPNQRQRPRYGRSPE